MIYLYRACEDGDAQTVKSILSAHPQLCPSFYRNWAINHACLNGYTEIVRILLEDGRVDPADPYNSPIIFASRNGYHEIVKLLLMDKRVDPADKNNEAIDGAGQYGHIEVVRLLLADWRVNPTGEDGIYRKIRNNVYREIAIIDDMLCYVKNGDVDSIIDDGIREKFIKWQYRIGGEKHALARNALELPP